MALRIAQIMLQSLFGGLNYNRSLRVRRSFVHHIFPVLGVELQVEGTPPDFPCIVLANHRSYLDPAVLVNNVHGFAVSKAEVEHWPLIGYGVKISGVLFLKRENPHSRKRTLQGIAQRVKEGWPVMLFPEGTTHGEPATIALRPGAFRLAAAENIPIVPAAIEYGSPDDYWLNDDGFLGHFIRRFGEKRMRVRVRYGPALSGNDSAVLLQQTRDWIDSALSDLQASLAKEN